ncbi:hypothetical protein HNP46_004127 [Pseudomonas nitritireducens]|uniref:Uncharacterized protein n=1 Tax=Pseudomonas nitroreducens TaxID=46680 RepID=A0A7W7KLY6_PSENT|nr:hypothetical protein [Pseudomonas nitritireducens]MBB4865247.1 hypothetical protein [Pseudomonas nitritireducens]
MRRLLTSVAGFLLLGWGQGLWALHPYRDNLTADVRSISLSQEMAPLLLFWALWIALAAWPRWAATLRGGVLSSGVALLGWFWVDLCLYDSRVASWSTYTLAELAAEVAFICAWPLLCAVLAYGGGWALAAWRKTDDPQLV